MGQALYRKYRSKSLEEIVGQDHITHTLAKAVKSGRISHAYLLTGPRGVGKTSIARILAHQINDLPYTDDSMHLDIIEIDAASNRRIDEIRELRERVYVAPTSAKYKVYIIDEVHMLTKEAFNALLKTLEEPPAHVVFILATTDAHKLPETIISRTQRYNFKPVPTDQVVTHLKTIAKAEKIKVSDQALHLLAEHGEGSFRDSISLLDQASSRGEAIELTDIESLLGIPSTTAIEQLLDSVLGQADISQVMQQTTGLYLQGYQAAAIAKELSRLSRSRLITQRSTTASNALFDLMTQLLEVPAAHDPERFLEIVLLRASTDGTTPAAAPPQAAKPVLEPVERSSDPIPKPAPQSKPVITPKAKVKTEPQTEATGIASLDITIWPQILGALKSKYNTLYGIVRMAQPVFDTPGTLELRFGFSIHQKRVNDAKNREILHAILKQLTGQAVMIDCVFDKDATTPKVGAVKAASVTTPAKATADISAISNIFGGGELLES